MFRGFLKANFLEREGLNLGGYLFFFIVTYSLVRSWNMVLCVRTSITVCISRTGELGLREEGDIAELKPDVSQDEEFGEDGIGGL